MDIRISLFALALLCVSYVSGGNAVNPDAIELSPIPRPVEMALDPDSPVALDGIVLFVGDSDEKGDEMDSISLKMPVTIKAKLTEKLRKRISDDL